MFDPKNERDKKTIDVFQQIFKMNPIFLKLGNINAKLSNDNSLAIFIYSFIHTLPIIIITYPLNLIYKFLYNYNNRRVI